MSATKSRLGRRARETKVVQAQRRVEAMCLEDSCDWEHLGRWAPASSDSFVAVTLQARLHAAQTGHQTMVDTTTRRRYGKRS